MATQIGTVSILIGTATATAADGTVRNLQLGDKIYADELISTGPGGAVEIEFADGTVMDLGRNSQLVLDDAVYDPNAVAEAEPAADADAIQQAILAGVDPTEITEATAAGAGAEAGGNEGSEFVTVEYLAPSVIPDSGFDTTGISVAFDEVDVEVPGPDDLPTLSINDVTVFEPTTSGEDGEDGGGQQTGSGGGAIFVTGHDSDEHSNIDYMSSGLDFLLFGQAVTIGERAGKTVAVIGDGSQSSFVSGLTADGWTVTFYLDGDPNITDAFNADAVLVESGNDSSLNTQLIALTDNFTDYINNGGSLYINTDEGGGQSWYNFVPSFGDTINTSLGGTGVYAVTGAGSAIGLSEPIVDADPTHSYFTGVDTSIFTIFEVADSEAVFGEDNGAAVAFGARNIGIDDGGFIPGGSVFAEFTVSLSSASTVDVLVDFVTADGTAISGGSGIAENDYGSTSGTVTIPAGSLSATIQVEIFGDNVTEITEQYFVTLSAPVNATIADGTGVGTILDNDLVEFSIEALSGSEGGQFSFVDEGDVASYTISYDGVLADGVQAAVTFDTASGTVVNFDAIEGVDFDESTGTVVFTGGTGVTSVTVFVQTTEDLLIENDEDYSINLISSSANSTINPSADHVDTTILDDDFPVVSIEPDTQNNGDIVEEGNALSYIVSLSAPGTSNAVVDLSFTGGTANDSGEDQDYIPTIYSDAGLTNVITSLTFTPGETAKTVYVNTLDNDPPLNEVDETVNVTVTASSGVTGTDEAVGTITDSDLPVVTIVPDTRGGGDTVEEGNVLSYVVSLSGASDQNAVVDLSFTGGTADNATDYTPTFYSDAGLTNAITSLTFTPGQTALTVYVGTADNDPPLNEVDETVNVTIQSPAPPSADLIENGLNGFSWVSKLINKDGMED
ncbi:hypothetical protein A9Q79_04260 [Methylophaga sp. 42_25_T18]|nr:hypothetical protein A9Q79_04260 [Methylophaga sp. 42_25_T18]OUR88691.1 hypothetical protein A9Q92_02620 [Methylophaga sp. 42_8_T64]